MTKILESTFTGVGTFLGAPTEIIISIVTVPFILVLFIKRRQKLPDYF
ncbi:hypothetical protein ACEQPO_23375 [Bacillus sp. SL00103]